MTENLSIEISINNVGTKGISDYITQEYLKREKRKKQQ